MGWRIEDRKAIFHEFAVSDQCLLNHLYPPFRFIRAIVASHYVRTQNQPDIIESFQTTQSCASRGITENLFNRKGRGLGYRRRRSLYGSLSARRRCCPAPPGWPGLRLRLIQGSQTCDVAGSTAIGKVVIN